MTVRQNIAFGLRMQGKGENDMTKTVDQMLDLMNLRSIEHHPPTSLSGGEKQKVALARALAINSPIILLDEPLASVDSATARQLRVELKGYIKREVKL